MARYQVILAYDGTDFCGFQRQSRKPDKRSVQSVVETALRKIDWQDRAILSAGRTDTGVHASGQVIAFDMEWRHSLEKLQAALNANLPPDVAARTVREVRANFHPRYDALARRYSYRIFCQPVRDPLRERYAWRIWPQANLTTLQEAATCLLGRHDFSAFGTPLRAGASTIRHVSRAEWQLEGEDFVFEIVANAFLYHMVRRLVSFLIKIGQGGLQVSQMVTCLEGSPPPVRELAPPTGLRLVEVIYPASIFAN